MRSCTRRAGPDERPVRLNFVLPLMGAGPIVCRPLVDPVVDRRLDIALRARRTLPTVTERFLETLEEFRLQGRPLPPGVSWA